jgi:subtilase family serine protease
MKVLLLVVAALAVALAAPEARNVFYNRAYAPPNWALLARADSAQSHTFKIALKQRNLNVLDDIFWKISDPHSPSYGQFLTSEQILDIVAPDSSVVNAVVDWLVSGGVERSNILNHRDALSVKAPAEVVEVLFQTKLYNFVHQESGRLLARNLGPYSVPSRLIPSVVMITGISDFPPLRNKVLRKNAATDANVIPLTLQKVYNIPTTLQITTTSSQGVAEFQNDASYNKDDLAAFYKEMGIATQPAPHIVGTYSGDYPDIEATLDYQYITALGQNASNWYWTEENWMYDFAVHLFGVDPAPMVLSISWGWSEADQCSIDQDCSNMGINSQQYVDRVNTEFQKIGARGITLLVSSGDSGCHGRTDGGCALSVFKPDFPGCSPYVTSVGATQLSATQTSSTAEPVCASYVCGLAGTEAAVSYDVSGFTSGGGFSNYAPLQDYQKDAVNAYFKSGVTLPASSYYNASGRGYPDVAALGHNYIIYASGSNQPVGGTSASSPAFAGVVALLNDHRLKKNGKPIGFANPLLYAMAAAHPAAFNDVTSGDNACTEDGCAATCKGFNAYKGWDPVTGLGSPNFGEMINYLDQLDRLREAKFGKH